MAQAAESVPVTQWIAKRSGAAITIKGKQFLTGEWMPVTITVRAIECTEGGVFAEATDGRLYALQAVRK